MFTILSEKKKKQPKQHEPILVNNQVFVRTKNGVYENAAKAGKQLLED